MHLRARCTTRATSGRAATWLFARIWGQKNGLSKVRDWQSRNGVFGSRGKGTVSVPPVSKESSNELIFSGPAMVLISLWDSLMPHSVRAGTWYPHEYPFALPHTPPNIYEFRMCVAIFMNSLFRKPRQQPAGHAHRGALRRSLLRAVQPGRAVRELDLGLRRLALARQLFLLQSPIPPSFSVLARACLWCLDARSWRVNLPRGVKSIPNPPWPWPVQHYY